MARVFGSTFLGLGVSRKPFSLSSIFSSTCSPTLHWQWLRLSSSSCRVSMSLKAGIVGLPNVGKSTLFNAVVENGKAQAANFPFCTIEPNVGIVAVPDPRLSVLSQLSKSRRSVPASIEFVDIAGLVKGASQGEGLGNKFLSHIREVDSILQVVRCFEDNDIVHVNGKIAPKLDIEVINLELIFSDLDQIEKRLEKLKKGKAKDSQSKLKEEAERSALEKIKNMLMDGKPARSVPLTDFEKDSICHLCLLTMKPVIYVANVAESDLADPSNNLYVIEVLNLASELQSGLVTISAQVESELTELPLDERVEYLKSLGVSESGLGNLIRETYNLLGLRTYFTSGEKETKAWTILAGMTAPQAAGVIHSDFEKGFIRAETVAYDDFVAAGSLAAAREKVEIRRQGLHCSRRRCHAFSVQRLNVDVIGKDYTEARISSLVAFIPELSPAIARFFGSIPSAPPSLSKRETMKKMRLLLRKCRSLSTRLGRSSSYTSLRSKFIRDEDLWCDGEAGGGGEDEAVVFVGSSRRRYMIRARHLSHPVIRALIDRSRQGSADDRISVKCEVVLFDHLLWMLENGDLEVSAEGFALEELAALYAY